MLKPFSYQREAQANLDRARRQGQNRALLVMASGLGKTVCVALDVRRWLRHYSTHRILFLCHQNDILEQAKKRFSQVLNGKATYGYLNGSQKSLHEVTCLFATFQTMRSWRKKFSPTTFGYVVVDESHHSPAATYRPTLKRFKPRFLLGVTATPDRTDLQDIRRIYGKEIYSLPLEEALARGLLTPVDYRLMTDEIRNLDILKTPVGRLSIRKLNRTLFVPKRDKEIARIIRRDMRTVPNPRVMIFCQSVAHCERMAKYLNGSTPIHYRLSNREQERRLDAFRRGEVRVILTVDKFNEGIDVPEANIIIFLRSTASRMLFFQQLGRGLRKFPGKKKVLVRDFVGNCEQLEIVHKLWTAVEAKQKKHRTRRQQLPLSVNWGRVNFSQTALNLLSVIAEIRKGYTREFLIKQLRDLAASLGRTPKRDELSKLSKAGKCPSDTAFTNLFGTYNQALEAAGLTLNINQSRHTRKTLIRDLKRLAKSLGRLPTNKDLEVASRKSKLAWEKTYRDAFGSMAKAFEAAGLDASIRSQSNQKGFTKKELINQLRRLKRRLKRTPTGKDIEKAAKAGKCASKRTFQKHFGAVTKALRVAGLTPVSTTWKRKHKK